MALTLEELRKLLDAEGVRYFVAPDRPAVLVGVAGAFGRYQAVVGLDMNGAFLQFRTLSYANCPAAHPHVPALLRVLADINMRLRLVKLAWDSSDGEVVVFADVWLMDNKLSQEQFSRLLHNYFPALDHSYPRVSGVIETGKDPGETSPEEMLKRLLGEKGALPPELRALLERLKPGGEKPKDEEEKRPQPEIQEI
jgi:hypothetical protein